MIIENNIFVDCFFRGGPVAKTVEYLFHISGSSRFTRVAIYPDAAGSAGTGGPLKIPDESTRLRSSVVNVPHADTGDWWFSTKDLIRGVKGLHPCVEMAVYRLGERYYSQSLQKTKVQV